MAGEIEQKFSSGLVKVTIWKNKSANGEFKTVSLNRSHMKDGEWKNTNSFGVNDIEKAISVLQQAQEYLESGSDEAAA